MYMYMFICDILYTGLVLIAKLFLLQMARQGFSVIRIQMNTQ